MKSSALLTFWRRFSSSMFKDSRISKFVKLIRLNCDPVFFYLPGKGPGVVAGMLVQ